MPQYKPGTIQIRRYSSAKWAALNPVLVDGEAGYDTGPAPSPTTGALKIGNGYSRWSELDTFAGPTGPQGPKGDTGAPGTLSLELADSSLVNTGTATNPILAVGDLSADYASAADLAALSAQQGQLMSVAATIEELSSTFRIGEEGGATITGSSVNPMWVAPCDCTIVSLTLTFAHYAQAVDASNYVEFALRKNPGGTNLFIVSKRTSDEAITALTPWRYTGASWNTTNQVLSEGDILSFNTIFTGSPSPVTVPIVGTFRYVPQ